MKTKGTRVGMGGGIVLFLLLRWSWMDGWWRRCAHEGVVIVELSRAAWINGMTIGREMKDMYEAAAAEEAFDRSRLELHEKGREAVNKANNGTAPRKSREGEKRKQQQQVDSSWRRSKTERAEKSSVNWAGPYTYM